MARRAGPRRKAPLADEAGAVAAFVEHFAESPFVRLQRGPGHVAANLQVAGVFAQHERGAGRRANGAAGIEIRETHPFGGEAVEIRRLDLRLAVAAEVAVAEVVGEDEHDARPAWRGRVGVRGVVGARRLRGCRQHADDERERDGQAE